MSGALSYAMRYSKSLGGTIESGFWGYIPKRKIGSNQAGLISTIVGVITNWYFITKGFEGFIDEIVGELHAHISKKALDGLVNSSGSLGPMNMKRTESGTLNPLGTLYDMVHRALYGGLTPTGDTRGYISKKALAGEITPTGAQTSQKIIPKHLFARERPLHLTSNRRGERIRDEY
jgi:hypothetical protein